MFNCSYCTGSHCSAVALSRTRTSTRLLRRKRPLLALKARTPLVRQLLQRISARPAPRRSTGPQSKGCTVRSERRHARLAHPSSTPGRWAAARCSSTRNYTTLLVLNYSSWLVFRSSTICIIEHLSDHLSSSLHDVLLLHTSMHTLLVQMHTRRCARDVNLGLVHECLSLVRSTLVVARHSLSLSLSLSGHHPTEL